ncbi:hypothetical protein LTS18_002323, partial [Coniosporium uncinatum]
GAPFELRPSPGKGWACFATRHIPTRSVILSEQALFTISGAPSDITETAIKNGYDKLSKQQKDMLSDLRNAQGRPFSNLSDLFNFNQHRYGVRGPEGSIQ